MAVVSDIQQVDRFISLNLKFLRSLREMNPQPLSDGQLSALEIQIENLKDAQHILTGVNNAT